MTQVNKTGHYLCRDGRVAYVNAVGRTGCKGFIYGTWRSWETWNLRGRSIRCQNHPAI